MGPHEQEADRIHGERGGPGGVATVAARCGQAWVRIVDVACSGILLALGLNIVVGMAGCWTRATSPSMPWALTCLPCWHRPTWAKPFRPLRQCSQWAAYPIWLTIPLGPGYALAGVLLGAPTLKLGATIWPS